MMAVGLFVLLLLGVGFVAVVTEDQPILSWLSVFVSALLASMSGVWFLPQGKRTRRLLWAVGAQREAELVAVLVAQRTFWRVFVLSSVAAALVMLTSMALGIDLELT